jgi:hypothetical protein
VTTPNATAGPDDALVTLPARSYYDEQAECLQVAVEDRHLPRSRWSIRVVHWLVDSGGEFVDYCVRLSVHDALQLADELRAAVDLVAPPVQPTSPGPWQDAFAVWREENRIRNAAGLGYGDAVGDEAIAEHAQMYLRAGRYRDAAFRVAVLSLRQQERETT